MQALLSYDQAPPLAAPLRFFLSAPLFGLLAGAMLLWGGADTFASRWTPAALAITHLVTVGFMLQIMLGAMLQILPVVAGANMTHPLRVARIVHCFTGLGALVLTAAFLNFSPTLFAVAAALLGIGVTIFVGAAGLSLWGVVSTSPTISGLKLSLIGLSVTVGLGLLLSLALGGWLGELELPVLQLADVHLVWGFVAWGTILLAAVAYVVVPMFQLTPAYPDGFGRRFAGITLALVSLWTVADLSAWALVAAILALAVLAAPLLFALLTLLIQRRSKRARFDSTQHYWRLALCATLAAGAVWLAGRVVPTFAERQEWPLLCGVLILFGGFVSVMAGMLYKIVPFLVWLHLQNAGQGREGHVMAPNMKAMISESAMARQLYAHLLSFGLLLLAVFWPSIFVYPAGVAVVVANGGLLRNLLSAVGVYRAHLQKIASVLKAV